MTTGKDHQKACWLYDYSPSSPSRKSKVPRVVDLVRDLTLCTLRYSFFFQAVHADSPSRFQMEHFHKLAPQFRASPDPIPRWVLTPSPNGEAQFYLGMALSQNTEKTYSSGMQQFYSFCSQTGITLTFPISEDILINFLVCMPQSFQHSTIKNYPPWNIYHSSHDYALNLPVFLHLQLILHGIKHFQGVNSKALIAHIKFISPPLKCQIYH